MLKNLILLKKKTNDDKAFKSQGEHSSDLKKEKYIKKKIKEIEKDLAIDKLKSEFEEKSNKDISLKDDKLKVFYRPDQIKLNQKDIIKVIEISSKLNKENILIIKSYASKLANQGSSEARRTSLSRALEIRGLLIENEFPATNILVRALGSENNYEGFTDLVVVEIN